MSQKVIHNSFIVVENQESLKNPGKLLENQENFGKLEGKKQWDKLFGDG